MGHQNDYVYIIIILRITCLQHCCCCFASQSHQ